MDAKDGRPRKLTQKQKSDYESGHGARPMDPQWVRDIRSDCEAMGIPLFFKQWGGVRKKAAGRELDGRTYDEFPATTDRLATLTESKD